MRSEAPGHESAKRENGVQAGASKRKGRAGNGEPKTAGVDKGVPVGEEIKPPVRLPPLLFFGPPGVSKAHLCDSLARMLGVCSCP